MFWEKTLTLPTAGEALPGRDTPLAHPDHHWVLAAPLDAHADSSKGYREVIFGLGCFWGAERLFWQLPGIISTAVGYAGGHTKNPTYEEVCSGRTGHTEVVRVVYDSHELSFEDLLKTFWEAHDPTQGMRQGNDLGTQYRSAIYVSDDTQRELAERSRTTYQAALTEARGEPIEITTEIEAAPPFYFAESYHQQYLAKNPGGYCGLAGTGVSCPREL